MNLVTWPSRDLRYRRTQESLYCYAVSFTDVGSPPLHSLGNCFISMNAPHVNLSDVSHIMWPDSEDWQDKHQTTYETLQSSGRQDLARWFDSRCDDQSTPLSGAVFLGESILGFKNRETDEYFRVSRGDLTDAGEALVSAMERAYEGNPVHLLTFMTT